MKTPKYQRGFDVLTFILWTFLIGIIVLLTVKLAPSYFDYMAAKSVVKSFEEELGENLNKRSKSEIMRVLFKRFRVNNLHEIKPEHVEISKSKGVIKIDIDYEVRIPMVKNVDVAIRYQAVSEVE